MKKVYIAVACVVVLLIIGGTFVVIDIKNNTPPKYEDTIYPVPDNINELPEANLESSYRFNPEDKELMSGFSDYIVVAAIDEIVGISYKNVTEEDGIVSGIPYTHYSARVLRNIKGELKTTENIPLMEYGGSSIDGKYLYRIIPLLETEKCYVLYLYSSDDGNLYLNQLYEMVNEPQEYESSDVPDEDIQIYLDAYENENTEFAPEVRYKSIYDMSTDGA